MAEPTITQASVDKLLPLLSLDDLVQTGSMKNMSDGDKALCETFIRTFSRLAENYTGRQLRLVERTKTFDIRYEQAIVRLNAYGHPDTAITTVWQSLGGVYDATTVLDPTAYTFDIDTGLLRKRFGCFLQGVGALRVKWTGGVAASVGQVPEDLRGVGVLQVAAWYQRRDQLNVQSLSLGGESSTRFAEIDLLPITKRVLDAYSEAC